MVIAKDRFVTKINTQKPSKSNNRTEAAALLLTNTWKYVPPEKPETQFAMSQHFSNSMEILSEKERPAGDFAHLH